MPSDPLIEIVKSSGLEPAKADFILGKFQDYFKIAAEWDQRAKAIVVTSPEQAEQMEDARKARVLLKSKRNEIEKTRKELKEQSLREGKAIDGIANVLKALIVPIEEYLEKQENFVELREAERKNKLRSERVAILQPFAVDTSLYDLGEMPQEQFTAIVDGLRLGQEKKAEMEKKAEEERREKELEDERIRLENERLKKEAIEKDKATQVEREKAGKERKALEEKARKEREVRQKAEAELLRRKKEEEAEKQRKAEEQRKAERAPDKEKLLSLRNRLLAFELPVVQSDQAKRIVDAIHNRIKILCNDIAHEAENL